MTKYEPLDPEFKKSIIEMIKTKAPFWDLLGLEPVDVKKGWAEVRLPFDRKLLHPGGITHGGAIFSLADSAVGMTLFGLVKKDEIFSTVEMKINYIRPFTGGELRAVAKITSKGRNLAVGDVEVKDNTGRLIAQGLATYMIMKKRS